MQTLGKIAATLGVVGAIAVGSTVPAAAWYGYHHHYYHHRYYGYHHRYYHHRYYASILGTMAITGAGTKRNFEAASTGGLLFWRFSVARSGSLTTFPQ